ncbi:MAG: hypothetical protein AAGG68_19730 [Bacteroidota bacterium]
MRYLNLFFLLLIILLLSCESPAISSTPAFYHWQTKLTLSEIEKTYFDSLSIQKLYVKFFDVDWDANLQQAVPSAELIWEVNQWEGVEIVPTIFITNRTLINTEREKITTLAGKIDRKIEVLAKGKEFSEWQIDCDWTKSTKEKYFQLLRELKRLNPERQLSATIRLHQVKFQEDTGVPPVDRGMLMYYNIGNISDWESENSIYEADLAAQYLGRMKKYPLNLDVVLPLFHWGLIYRDGELFRIINNLSGSDLEKKCFKQLTNNRYEVVKATYLEGHYLYEGDQIRLEQISKEQLQIANQQLFSALAQKDRTIAFYHLDEEILKNWDSSTLQDIWKKHGISQ